MIICAIKLTHDGAIALVDNGTLIFCHEMEKIGNSPRHSNFNITFEEVGKILLSYGYNLNTIDQFVIDGWDNWDPKTVGSFIPRKNSFGNFELAEYGHLVKKNENILATESFEIAEYKLKYKSYKHVSGHVIGAYCTSPFPRKKEDSYILVWDGGMPPQLFYYHYHENKVENLGILFPFIGYMYITFAQAFEPFNVLEKDLSIAGKLMAYIALGSTEAKITSKYREVYAKLSAKIVDMELDIDIVTILTEEFIKEAKSFCSEQNCPQENMLTTFHFFIQELIIEKLKEKVIENPSLITNFCFAGGSALNIKWNSAIRNSGIFKHVWVPPFPNDSGSAIGAACCEMLTSTAVRSLEWNVYRGPEIIDTTGPVNGYLSLPCNLKQLANIIHEINEPIIFLNDTAEIGPRSLGNRSILATSNGAQMKSLLNSLKNREDYRPIAPICLEEDASNMFEPGSPDPYMLFEHVVKADWINKIPAVCHLDNTARLQTVNKNDNKIVYDLLTHYKEISGLSLLCNTSANFKGKGFFPDVKSAMEWGKANLIWSKEKIYFKTAMSSSIKQVLTDSN